MYMIRFKYRDYDGVEHESDEYFNINSAELQEMNFTTTGGIIPHISHLTGISTEELTKKMTKQDASSKGLKDLDVRPYEENAAAIYMTFKNFVLHSYGKKVKGLFMKDDQIRKEFECSKMFPELMQRLGSDEKFAKEFFSSIFEEPASSAPAVPAM